MYQYPRKTMGVASLPEFLKRKGQLRRVNVLDEIYSWKRSHPNCSPTIIIDCSSPPNVGINMKNHICGGRFGNEMDKFEELLTRLKMAGANLVFFSNLGRMKAVENIWLKRCEETCNIYVKFYDEINREQSLNEMAKNKEYKKNLCSAESSMNLIAQKHGQFFHVSPEEYDAAIAKFANENRVFAVMSEDYNLFIFQADWAIWSNSGFGYNRKQDKIFAKQYNRNALEDTCGITTEHRPLFATVLGNKIIKPMKNFFREFGPNNDFIQNVAQYVNGIQGTKPVSDEMLKIVATQTFGYVEEWPELKKSIDWYTLKRPITNTIDHIAELLKGTAFYGDYIKITRSDAHRFSLNFYDMRGNVGNKSITQLFITWLERKIGIVKVNTDDDPVEIIVFAKLSFDDEFSKHQSTPVYPQFFVPPLDELYFNPENREIQWKLLAWIMTLNNDEVTALQGVPESFQLICTTLLALVKNDFLTIEQADGILYTEFMIQHDKDAVRRAEYPDRLVENYVRVAHLYNLTTEKVRQNFAIAGVPLSIDSCIARFDGVFFQNAMNTGSWQPMLNSYSAYRVYVE